MAETYGNQPIDASMHGQMTGSGADRAYITKQGDTLEGIAAFFYGAPEHRQRLIDDNPSWNGWQPNETVPAGIQLKVGEDAGRGDTVT